MDVNELVEFVGLIEKVRREDIRSTMDAVNHLNRQHLELFEKFRDVVSSEKNVMGNFVDGYSLDDIEDDDSTPAAPQDDSVSGGTNKKRNMEDEKLDSMMRLSKVITNRLQLHVDHNKKMHEMIMGTHKKSFELFQMFDNYLDERRKKKESFNSDK